jgi:predicted nucleic acid-binding protein
MNAIDTNIWLYSQDARDPRKQGIAQQLIAASGR